MDEVEEVIRRLRELADELELRRMRRRLEMTGDDSADTR